MRVFELIPLKSGLFLRLYLSLILADIVLNRLIASLVYVPIVSELIGASVYLAGSIFVFLLTFDALSSRRSHIDTIRFISLALFLGAVFALAALRSYPPAMPYIVRAIALFFLVFVAAAVHGAFTATADESLRAFMIMAGASSAAGALYALMMINGSHGPFSVIARYFQRASSLFYAAAAVYLAVRLIMHAQRNGVNTAALAFSVLITSLIASASIISSYGKAVTDRIAYAVGLGAAFPIPVTSVLLAVVSTAVLYVLFDRRKNALSTALASALFLATGASFDPLTGRLAAIAVFSLFIPDETA